MIFVFRISEAFERFEILVENSDNGNLSSITVRWNTYLLFNSDSELCVESRWGKTESIVLLIFALWRCFNHQRVRGGGLGLENLIQGQLKSHPFSGGILAEAIRMTNSCILYRVDISTFHFYEPLPFQIFVSWKFIKT